MLDWPRPAIGTLRARRYWASIRRNTSFSRLPSGGGPLSSERFEIPAERIRIMKVQHTRWKGLRSSSITIEMISDKARPEKDRKRLRGVIIIIEIVIASHCSNKDGHRFPLRTHTHTSQCGLHTYTRIHVWNDEWKYDSALEVQWGLELRGKCGSWCPFWGAQDSTLRFANSETVVVFS